MPNSPKKEWYTVAEAADLLQVDGSTIRRYIRNGRLRGTRKVNLREYSIPADAISHFQEEELQQKN